MGNNNQNNINSRDCVSKKEAYSPHGSINSSDIKMSEKDYKRKIETERKLAGYREQMSQLADRLATDSFQG